MENLELLVNGNRLSTYQKDLAKREFESMRKELNYYKNIRSKYVHTEAPEMPNPEKIDRKDTDTERLNLEEQINWYEVEIEWMESVSLSDFDDKRYTGLHTGLDRARGEMETRINARKMNTNKAVV